MNNKIKKVVHFRFDHYQDIETKLEKLAAKGLFLEQCGAFLWTFKKDEPKRLKYTVTYFSEGSVFNPAITDHQQTYFDYATAAGWNFVTQFHQIQIFCSDAENPIPFETDEREKFENIKKCMKKSFLPSVIAMILVFSLNLLVQFDSFQFDPINFLSDANRLLSVGMIFAAILYFLYSLIDYLVWCKRSDHAILSGGACVENRGVARRVIDLVLMCYLFGSLGWFLFQLIAQRNWFSLVIGIVQMPILLIVFWSSINYLKKKKASAMMNRIISFTALTLATFAYLTLIILFIINSDFHTGGEPDYRTVTWEMSPTVSHDYRLYSEEIPLTCEDLYGQIDYDYYSYEAAVDRTMFLAKSSYRQDSLPAKDAPPRLEYEILKPQFAFVYDLAKKHLLETAQWRDEWSMKPIDNEIFGTVEAYQKYYQDNPTGEYLVFFKDKIATLYLEDVATPEQVTVIKEKLQF